MDKTIKDHVLTVIQKHFKFDIAKRLRIINEKDKFRVKEDEELSKMARSGQNNYEVYFDNVFVAFFNDKENPPVVEMRIVSELFKLWKDKKIFWNEWMYRVHETEQEEKAKKEKQDLEQSFENKLKSTTNGQEKMVHKAIQKALKNEKR